MCKREVLHCLAEKSLCTVVDLRGFHKVTLEHVIHRCVFVISEKEMGSGCTVAVSVSRTASLDSHSGPSGSIIFQSITEIKSCYIAKQVKFISPPGTQKNGANFQNSDFPYDLRCTFFEPKLYNEEENT